ncbi:unnamed protein product [Timema podura]|uniref:Uncharacterized protein n=1 Tax=Timema podura TaxID=61482 RepID=A0ABN7NHC2_TIMPD|nr:unnamed protein product [Timema podura]
MEEVEQEYRDRKLEVKRVVREEKDMMGGVCTEITGRQHRDYENAVWNVKILKQPKVRAPFRDLGLNLSTDDEGTANMTRTRRVSFSVTQIKEFHSNADVDTFWGSTYEKKFQQTDSSSNSSCESSSFSLRGVNTTICTGVDTAGRLVDDQSLEPGKISSWRHDHQRQITQESTHLKPSDLPSCDKSLSDTLLKETRFQAFECHNNSDSLLSFASVQKESDFTGDFMKKVGRQSPDKPFSPVFKFDINSSKKPMCSDIFGFPGKKCSYIEIPKNILHGSHSKELNLFSKLIVTDKLVSIGNRPASDNSNIKSEEAQNLSYSFDKARMPDRNENSHYKQSRIGLNISCSSSMDSVSMNEDDIVFLNQSSSSEEINPTTLTQNTNLVGFLSVPVKHDDTNVKNSTYYHQDFTGSTMGCVKILGGNQSTSRFQETSVNLDKTQASLSGEKSSENGTEYIDKLMLSHVNKSCHTNLDLTNALKTIQGRIPSINESVNSDMDCTEPLGGIIGGISNLRETLVKSDMECTKTGGGINCGMSHLNESVTSDMEYTEPLDGIQNKISQLNESVKSDMEFTEPLGGIHNKMSQLNKSAKSNMECTEPFGRIHNRISQLNEFAMSNMECTEPLGDMECTGLLGGIHNRISQLNESAKSNMECTEPLGGIHKRTSQLDKSVKSDKKCTEPLGGIHNRMSLLNKSAKSDMECTEPLGGIHNRTSQLNETSTTLDMEYTDSDEGINCRMSQLNEATVNSDIECLKTVEINYPRMSNVELTNPSLSNSVSYKSCNKLSKAMVPLEHKDTEQCTKLIDTQIVSQKGISVQSPTNETFKEILSRSIRFAELVKHPQREEKTKSIHLVDLCNSSLNQLHSEENNSRTFPESVMELSEPIKQGNEEASMKSNDLCDISCSQSDDFKFETTQRSCHGIDMECTKVIPSLDDSSKETLGSSLNRGVFCVQSQKPKSVSMGGPQTSELIFEVNNDNNKTICLDSQSKSEISSHLVNTFPSVSDHDQRNQSPVFFDVKNMESLSAKHDTTRFGKGNQSYLHTHGTNVEQTTKPIKEISLVKRCVVSSDKGNQVPSTVAEDKIDEKSNPSLTIQELRHKERMPNSPTHDLALNKLTSHKSVSETGNNDKSPLPLKHSLIDDSHEHISLNTKLENSCVLDLSHLPPKKRAYEISAQLSESNLEVDLIPCKKQCIPAEIHKPTSLLEDVSSNEMCLNAICGTTQCNQGKHMPHKNTSSSEKSVSFVNSSCTTCDTSMLLCQPALPYNSSDNLSKDMTIKQVYEVVTNMVEYLHNLPENCSKVVNKNISIVDKTDGGAGNTNVSFHPDIKKLDSFDSSNELLQPNREINPSEPRNMVNTLPNISSNGYTALIENSFISTDSSSMLPKDQNLNKYDEYIVKSTILNDSRNVKTFSASPDETLYQKDTQQCDVTTSLKIDTPTDFIDNDINKETQSNTTKTSADAVQGTLEKELSHSIQSKASGMSFYGKENNMLHSPDSYKDNSDVKLTDEVDKSQEVCLRSDQSTKHATIVSSLSSIAVNDRDSSRFLEFQHQALSDSDVPKTVAFETTDCVPMTSSLIKLSYALCSDGPTPRQDEGASEFSVMPSPKRDTPRTDDLANSNKSMAHMATKSPISKAPSNALVAKKMLFTVEEVIQEKYSNKSSPLAIKAMNDLEWAFTFLYDSLELIIKLETNKNSIYKSVTVVFLHSRVTEKTDSMGRWAHHVVLAKWSNGYLQSRCKTTQHVPKLLDDLSGTITQLTEFIMEYDCIRAKELVRIADNKVSFDMSSIEPLLWFRVTVDLSHWEIVLPSDISIQDIVGHVRTQDVQNLVSGVDKGPQFLRHYIRDINEYLNILNLYHQ